MNPYPIDLSATPEVKAFLDEPTNTISYLIRDPDGDACALIDTVMDFDAASGRTGYRQADLMIEHINTHQLKLEWIIETHVHADHLSAAPYIQERLGGKIGIGEKILEVQNVFGKVFNEGTEFKRDGSQFDALFKDGDVYTIGALPAFTMHTPGHTPACMVHVIGDAAFTGDTLFMPDGGSARCDFPGGDAGQLYDSIGKLMSLPDETRLFICHDYGPNGRAIAWETTVKEQKQNNIHAHEGVTREQFVEMRTKRDATLRMPGLILPSLQVNMRAGELPVDDHGNPTLRIPINGL